MAAPASNFTVPGSSSAAPAAPSSNAPKKRKHRSSKLRRKRDRRKSFAITNDDMNHDEGISSSMAAPSQSFYGQRHNLSGTSIESEALLDHRYSSFYTATSHSVPPNLSPIETSPILCALGDPRQLPNHPLPHQLRRVLVG